MRDVGFWLGLGLMRAPVLLSEVGILGLGDANAENPSASGHVVGCYCGGFRV